MKYLRILTAVLVAALALAGFASTAKAEDKAMVSVLHAVPGATVDVWANGEPLLEGFEPGSLTDPLELPAGSYDLKVVAAGDPADADAIMEAMGVEVPAGANATIVAHLDADGNPKLTPFVNDTSMIEAGKGRLTVRHVAAAPEVDVRANEEVAFESLANPNEAKADLGAGTISADVVLAGTDTVAIGPADVNITEGTNTIVYAWGSAADENLALAVQTISGLGDMPAAPDSGNGTSGFAAAGLAAVVAAGLVVAARRNRADA